MSKGKNLSQKFPKLLVFLILMSNLNVGVIYMKSMQRLTPRFARPIILSVGDRFKIMRIKSGPQRSLGKQISSKTVCTLNGKVS